MRLRSKLKDHTPVILRTLHSRYQQSALIQKSHFQYKSQISSPRFCTETFKSGNDVIYIHKTEDYVKVKRSLEETNTNFYTYTRKEEKVQSFFLKGLNKLFSEEEI